MGCRYAGRADGLIRRAADSPQPMPASADPRRSTATCMKGASSYIVGDGSALMLITSIVLSFAAAANAAPAPLVYLSCSLITDDGSTIHLNIAADEANQIVTKEIIESGYT